MHSAQVSSPVQQASLPVPGLQARPGMFQRLLEAGTEQSRLARRLQVMMSWSVNQADLASTTFTSSLKHQQTGQSSAVPDNPGADLKCLTSSCRLPWYPVTSAQVRALMAIRSIQKVP